MEENDQTQAGPHLCRKGCGFYGSPNFDGFCSKCHRDMQEASKRSANLLTSSDCIAPTPYTSQKCAGSDAKQESEGVGNSDSSHASSSMQNTVVSASESEAISVTNESAPKKRPRCMVCNKRVGLTGFTCRCGGLYCTIHRYSDSHDCSFDYRESGQADIRKANPQVICSKINKI